MKPAPPERPAPSLEARRTPRKWFASAFTRPLSWAVAAAACLAAWLAADHWLREAAYADLVRTAQNQVELYYTGVESELARFENAPAVFHLDPDIVSLLTAQAPAMRERVNRKLFAITRQMQASGIYIVSKSGQVVAASDWAEDFSPMGRNWLATRPVGEALHAGSDRSYASGPVRENPRFTFSQSIEHEGRVLGIAVVQADLGGIEKSWWPGGQRAILLDQNGGVILSSTRDWKYKLVPLFANERATSKAMAQRFNQQEVGTLEVDAVRKFDDGSLVVRIPTPTPQGPVRVQFVARYLTMPTSGWTVVALIDGRQALASAANGAIAITLAVALCALLVIFLRARQQVLRHEQAAHDELEQAYAQLEHVVQDRTAELRQANGELRTEVAQRQQAQEELVRAQDQLVQAGQLATLGQMAAGITHELGQPLQALNMHCNNAHQLSERGAQEGVRRNLGAIRDICERMQRILGQLRGFARKDTLKLQPVDVALAARKSLEILTSRITGRPVEVVLQVPAGTRVLADAHRLEQVFINLLGNAMDAAASASAPLVQLSAWRADGRVRVQVADNGPGIPPEAMERLFEPFFTTKGGQGMGLGLVISASILRACGARLAASNGPEGGALFEFTLEEASDA